VRTVGDLADVSEEQCAAFSKTDKTNVKGLREKAIAALKET